MYTDSMKKIVITLFICILAIGSVFAKTNSSKTIKFDNQIFTLKFSDYSKATKSYINEYYKGNENGDKWTDLIGIYHIKNYSKPFNYAKDLAAGASKQSPLDAQVMYNEKENTAIVNFILVGDTGKYKYLEQNIFKIEKVKGQSGVIAIQFAHKYPLNNKEEADKFKEQLPDKQAKWLMEIDKLSIPNIVERNIKSW